MMAVLDEQVDLPRSLVESFRRDGHALVPGLLPAHEAERWRQVIEPLAREHAWDTRPIEERDTYGKSFLQTFNLWQQSAEVARFSCARRFAKVAADLLGVESVRMYHDQALCKEPGGGPTPWHQDHNYWPLDGKTITMWMPLVDVPAVPGSMRFVPGSHEMGDLAGGNISDESDRALTKLIADRGWRWVSHGAVGAGDATFHAGWTLHSAGGNPTDLFRTVMTVIYVDATATVAAEITDQTRLDHQIWLEGVPPGGPLTSPLNPVLWPVSPA